MTIASQCHKFKRCIEVVNEFQRDGVLFEDFEVEEEGLDFSTFTSIWKNPERLADKDDFSLLCNVLFRGIEEEKYEETLNICLLLRKNSSRNEVKEIFDFLLLSLLSIRKSSNINPHVLLDWLEAGDRFFCSENNDVFSKRTYAFLKLHFLFTNRKSKLECFSCGCVQRYFVELYIDNNNRRLLESLNSLISLDVSFLHPTIKRLFKSVESIPDIECFEFYIELLGELRNCKIIDEKEESSSIQLIRSIGLISLLKMEDVPKACSAYNNLGSACGNTKKKNPTVENVLKNKLIPKVFDCLNQSKSEIFSINRTNLQKTVDIVVEERYPRTNLFEPLKMINSIFREYDVWDKFSVVLTKRMSTLSADANSFSIIIIYYLSLIYKNGAELLENLLERLKSEYHSASLEAKSTILSVVDIIKNLGESNASILSVMSGKLIKSNLLLETELNSTGNISLVLDNIEEFNTAELKSFLEKNSSSLSADSFPILVEKLDEMNLYIPSDKFWERLLGEEEMCKTTFEFIKKQVVILIQQQNQQELTRRVNQLFKQAKNCSSTKLPSRTLVLYLPKVLLSFSDPQFSLLPLDALNTIIPICIFGYCVFYDENEHRVIENFQLLLSKVSGMSCSTPIESIEQICRIVKSGSFKGCNISFLKPSTEDHIVNSLSIVNEQLIDVSKSSLFSSPEVCRKVRKRIVDVSSVIFQILAEPIQRFGDRGGKTPFCQLAKIIEKYSEKPDDELLNEKISERAMDAYSQATDKWNMMYVRKKVLELLQYSKTNKRLLENLMAKIRNNAILLEKFKGRKEFIEIDEMISQ